MSFVTRVLVTYFLSLALVAGVLSLLQKCPWEADTLLAIKRVIIVAFPASLAGSVTNALK